MLNENKPSISLETPSEPEQFDTQTKVKNNFSKNRSKNQVWLEKQLPILAMFLLGGLVSGFSLLLPSFFQDDRYNLGLIRHSVLPQAQHWLETSFVQWYFEPYPSVRAEDWHRSLYLLLLTVWERLVGSNNEVWLRLPHLGLVGLWLYLSFRLFWSIRQSLIEQPPPLWRERYFSWRSVVLMTALTFNPWAWQLLSRPYLDDLAAGVCMLAALVILAEKDQAKTSTLALAGGLCGLAVLMKDFYTIWIGLGLIILISLGISRHQNLKHIINGAIVFGLACIVVIVPKYLWAWYDLGKPVATAVLYANSSFFLTDLKADPPISIHHLYYFYNDASYLNPLQAVGGWQALLKKIVVAGPLSDTLRSLQSLSFAWVWLLPLVVLWNKKFRQQPQPLQLLIFSLIVSLVSYSFFFGVGGGQAAQLRYWLIPITLACVVGLAVSLTYLNAGRVAWLIMIAFLLIAPTNLILLGHLKDDEPLSSSELAVLKNNLRPGQTLLIDPTEGLHFWSLNPASLVVGLPDYEISSLRPEPARRFLATYQPKLAFYKNGPALERLKSLGFSEIWHDDQHILLERTN